MEIRSRVFGARCASILFFLFLLSMVMVNATPTLNPYDTQPIYSPLGLEKYYKKQKKAMVNILLSPFYQFSKSARDEEGNKVWAGDRLGQTNMFGLLWDRQAAPSTKTIDISQNFEDQNAYEQAITKEAWWTGYENNPATQNRYQVSKSEPALFWPPSNPPKTAAGTYNLGLVDPKTFDPANQGFVYASTPLKYEKTGLRGKVGFETKWGLGVALKSGLANVKQDRQLVSVKQYTGVTTIPDATYLPYALEQKFSSDIFSFPQAEVAVPIYYALYNPPQLDQVAKQLDLSLQSFSKTTMEDTYLQLYWNIPWRIHNEKGEEALSIIPYLAVGFSVPSGNEIDQNNPYSVSTGNDGFFGISCDANLSFDFPMIPKDDQHLQIAFGAGFVFFPERDIKDYRTFTNQYQRGLIPWQTSISKEPGITWYGNIAFKADNFIQNVNAYVEYVYTQHEKDEITLRESDKTRATYFKNGIPEMQRISSWQNQQMNFGIAYQVVPQLSFGFAVQAQISGKRVIRAVTTLGTMSFTF